MKPNCFFGLLDANMGYNMAPASAASQLEKVTCPLCLSLFLSLFVDISLISYISMYDI